MHRDRGTRRRVAVILTYRGIVEAVGDVSLAHSRTLTDAPDEVRAMVSDLTEEGNLQQLDRLIDLAVENVRQALGGYNVEETPGTAADDNRIQPGDRVVFRMTVPAVYGRTSTHLSTFCNQYVVNKVMEEWLRIVYPKTASGFAEAAEECKISLKRALNRRVGGTRIKMNPF